MADPFVSLMAAAAATRTIKLGTGICLVVEHDPIVLAKSVATLDWLSRGRVLFGIGGGWNREEMEHHGTPFAKRWRVLRERVPQAGADAAPPDPVRRGHRPGPRARGGLLRRLDPDRRAAGRPARRHRRSPAEGTGRGPPAGRALGLGLRLQAAHAGRGEAHGGHGGGAGHDRGATPPRRCAALPRSHGAARRLRCLSSTPGPSPRTGDARTSPRPSWPPSPPGAPISTPSRRTPWRRWTSSTGVANPSPCASRGSPQPGPACRCSTSAADSAAPPARWPWSSAAWSRWWT